MLYPRKVNPTVYFLYFDSHGCGKNHWITALLFGLDLVSWGFKLNPFQDLIITNSPSSIWRFPPYIGASRTLFPSFWITYWSVPRSIIYFKKLLVLGSVIKSLERNGLSYSISKGLRWILALGTFLILCKAIGSNWVHFPDVSWQNLAKVCLIVWLAFSTLSEDWGLQAQCK
jgi:hypothetical protein